MKTRKLPPPAVRRRILLILLIFTALAVLMTVKERKDDTAADGYLPKNENGGGSYDTELTAQRDGVTADLTVTVEEQSLSKAQTDALLAEAETFLRELLPAGKAAEHVDRDLHFPEQIEGSPVSVLWISEMPDLISHDGTLCREPPEEGAQADVRAVLSLGKEVREVPFSFRVYPPDLTSPEMLARLLRAAAELEDDPSSDRLLLPSQIEGKSVLWKMKSSRTGLLLLAIGLLAAAAMLAGYWKETRDEGRNFEKTLLHDYPDLVDTLVLLISAGMSSRGAVGKIALDYKKETERGCAARPGYELFLAAHREMQRGVSEYDAYLHLGQSCHVSRYKTLSSLLVQNLEKGGSAMQSILLREAKDAADCRLKEARIRGEEAGTKLLAPMLLMLGIVLVFLTVPAFLTFF